MIPFTDRTFEFFLAIRLNNNRAFFQENHDWYAQSVREPFFDLAAALSPWAAEADGCLETDPARCVTTINRPGFKDGQSPYRDHLWLSFWPRREDRALRLSFSFFLSPEGGRWGVSTYFPNQALMARLRRELLERPGDFRRALAPAKGMRPQVGYKRRKTPPELSEDLAEWYTGRTFGLMREEPDWPALEDPELWMRIRADFESLLPMYWYITGLIEEE